MTQAVSEILEPYVREVPPRFTDWTRRVYGRMGLRLTKAQHATARVAFDGADPETQLERDIFGGITHVPAGARRMIVLRFGRDSGKTQLCSMFGLHRMLVGDLSRCGPGDDPAVAIVSPRKKQSRIALKRALATCAKWHPLGEGEPPDLVDARKALVLVLDDLGLERDPCEIIDVIHARYETGLVTWTTTGLGLDELRSKYGEAVTRRLVEGQTSPGRLVSCFEKAKAS